MKTLELKLKKDVLIVDAINQDIANGIIFQKFGVKTLSEFEFLCKGSELTEEIASDIFEHDDFLNRFESYIDTVPSIDESALKLFIKIFESKGFYWLENHIEKPVNFDLWRMYGDYTQYGKVLTEKCLKWKESEEKTFRNPLIFMNK